MAKVILYQDPSKMSVSSMVRTLRLDELIKHINTGEQIETLGSVILETIKSVTENNTLVSRAIDLYRDDSVELEWKIRSLAGVLNLSDEGYEVFKWVGVGENCDAFINVATEKNKHLGLFDKSIYKLMLVKSSIRGEFLMTQVIHELKSSMTLFCEQVKLDRPNSYNYNSSIAKVIDTICLFLESGCVDNTRDENLVMFDTGLPKFKSIEDQLKDGEITINQARVKMGREPVDGGDVYSIKDVDDKDE